MTINDIKNYRSASLGGVRKGVNVSSHRSLKKNTNIQNSQKVSIPYKSYRYSATTPSPSEQLSSLQYVGKVLKLISRIICKLLTGAFVLVLFIFGTVFSYILKSFKFLFQLGYQKKITKGNLKKRFEKPFTTSTAKFDTNLQPIAHYRPLDFSHCQSNFDYFKELSATVKSFFDYNIYSQHKQANHLNRMRLLYCAVYLCAILILFRVYQIQHVQYDKWSGKAANQQNRLLEINGVRGVIYDVDHRILATSVPSTSLAAHPRQIEDLQNVVSKVSAVTAISQKELKAKLDNDKNYVWLARGLPFRILDEIKALKLRGIIPVKEYKRYYPFGSLASTVLGRVSRDGKGQSGIEAKYNDFLTADGYNIEVYRDNKGNHIASYGDVDFSKTEDNAIIRNEKQKEAENAHQVRHQGSNILLTLNVYLQGFLEEEFALAQEQAKAKSVFGILMDADTGEVLAMAQTPRVNFNYENISLEQLSNFAIQENFEPGSTVKPIITALALDKKTISKNDIINCENGKYRIADVTIKDNHPMGNASVAEILEHSSNIGMIKIVEKLGKHKLADGLHEFGFGAKTGIELYGEEAGILHDVKKWGDVDAAAHAFGQGFSVTALQIMQAYTALANGGMLVQPYIVKEEGKVNETKRVLKQETADAVFEMLTRVTSDGTGKSAKIDGVKVAGKTGTAQKARADGKGYAIGKIFSSYVGIVDAKALGIDRRLIMFVGIDEPGTASRWGGVLAAPVFKRAMDRVLSWMIANNKS